MSLLERIKRLEKRRGDALTTYCKCFDKYFEAALEAVYDGKPWPESEPREVSGVCSECGEKVRLEILQYNARVEFVYGGLTEPQFAEMLEHKRKF